MKTYTLARGGYADKFRKHTGRPLGLRDLAVPHEIIRAAEPGDALRLYRGEWRPCDVVFEVTAVFPGPPMADGAPTARELAPGREVPPAALFGPHAARAARVTDALDELTTAALGCLMETWLALPGGWGHCDCPPDPDGCDCEPAPGSSAALADWVYPDRDDIDPRAQAAACLMADWARPVVKANATALWWYRLGQHDAGAAIPHPGNRHTWLDDASTAGAAMIGAALCWDHLAAADRQTWDALADRLTAATAAQPGTDPAQASTGTHPAETQPGTGPRP